MQEYLSFNLHYWGSLLLVKILPVTIILLITLCILSYYHLKTISIILMIITFIVPIPLVFSPLMLGVKVSQESGVVQPALAALSFLIVLYIPALSSLLLMIFLRKRDKKSKSKNALY